MQTPPQRKVTSLLGYALLSSLLIYVVYSFLQTLPLMYGVFVLLQTPLVYLTNAAANGASPDAIMKAWEKIINVVLVTEPILLFSIFMSIVQQSLYYFPM